MWTDHETNSDYLANASLAKKISSLLLRKELYPQTIGVMGGWGSGKSTVLKLIQKKLQQEADFSSKYIIVDFDAWRVEGYDEIRAALFEAITVRISELIPEDSRTEKLKRALGRINYLRLIGMGARIGATAATGLPFIFGTGEQGADASLDEIDKLANSASGILKTDLRAGGSASAREIADFISNTLDAAGVQMIVFVDNIDRCSPDNSINVLEAVKNVLYLNSTAFIFALDERVVRAAVVDHYSLSDASASNDYLDKFIQFPFRLRPATLGIMRSYLVGLYAERFCPELDISDVIMDTHLNEPDTLLSIEQTMKKFDYLANEAGMSTDTLQAFIGLANFFVTAPGVYGNPRAVKRILNAAEIASPFDAQTNMNQFSAALKLICFERIASPQAYRDLIMILDPDTGPSTEELDSLEEDLAKGAGAIDAAPASWKLLDVDFFREWLQIEPSLSVVRSFMKELSASLLDTGLGDGKLTKISQGLTSHFVSDDVINKPSTVVLLEEIEAPELREVILEVEKIKTLGHAEERKSAGRCLAAFAQHRDTSDKLARRLLDGSDKTDPRL